MKRLSFDYPSHILVVFQSFLYFSHLAFKGFIAQVFLLENWDRISCVSDLHSLNETPAEEIDHAVNVSGVNLNCINAYCVLE